MFILLFITSLFSNIVVFTEGSALIEKGYSPAKKALTKRLYSKSISTYLNSEQILSLDQKKKIISRIYPRVNLYISSYKIIKEKTKDDVLSISMNVTIDNDKLKKDLVSFGIIRPANKSLSKIFILYSFYKQQNSWLSLSTNDLEIISKPLIDKRFIMQKTGAIKQSAPILDEDDLPYSPTQANLLISTFVDYKCLKDNCVMYAYGIVFKNNKTIFSENISEKVKYASIKKHRLVILENLISSLAENLSSTTNKEKTLIVFKDLEFLDYKKIRRKLTLEKGILSDLKESYNKEGELGFTTSNTNKSILENALKRFCKKNKILLPFYVKKIKNN